MVTIKKTKVITIDSSGRVNIPKEQLKELNISPGDNLASIIKIFKNIKFLTLQKLEEKDLTSLDKIGDMKDE